MRKSVGGSRPARANLLDGMVVMAPPPVSRGALESLNVVEMFGNRGSGAGGSPAVDETPATTATSTTQKQTSAGRQVWNEDRV